MYLQNITVCRTLNQIETYTYVDDVRSGPKCTDANLIGAQILINRTNRKYLFKMYRERKCTKFIVKLIDLIGKSQRCLL